MLALWVSQSPQFNSVAVFRTIDGAYKGYQPLRMADPGQTLRSPGGEIVWTDYPDLKATTSAKFTLQGLSSDTNFINNTASATVLHHYNDKINALKQPKLFPKP